MSRFAATSFNNAALQQAQQYGQQLSQQQANPQSLIVTAQMLEQSGIPLLGIGDPGDTDVLCGRGGAALRHPGNQTYRRLVNLNKGLYITCLKTEKLKISRSIVAAIREQKGRFLEKDAKTDLHYDIGDKKAIEKTSQALREGQPKLRQKIVEMGAAAPPVSLLEHHNQVAHHAAAVASAAHTGSGNALALAAAKQHAHAVASGGNAGLGMYDTARASALGMSLSSGMDMMSMNQPQFPQHPGQPPLGSMYPGGAGGGATSGGAAPGAPGGGIGMNQHDQHYNAAVAAAAVAVARQQQEMQFQQQHHPNHPPSLEQQQFQRLQQERQQQHQQDMQAEMMLQRLSLREQQQQQQQQQQMSMAAASMMQQQQQDRQESLDGNGANNTHQKGAGIDEDAKPPATVSSSDKSSPMLSPPAPTREKIKGGENNNGATTGNIDEEEDFMIGRAPDTPPGRCTDIPPSRGSDHGPVAPPRSDGGFQSSQPSTTHSGMYGVSVFSGTSLNSIGSFGGGFGTGNSSTNIKLLAKDYDRRHVMAKMKYNRPPSINGFGLSKPSEKSLMDGMPDIHMVESSYSLMSNVSNLDGHHDTSSKPQVNGSSQKQHHDDRPPTMAGVTVETAKVVDHSGMGYHGGWGGARSNGSDLGMINDSKRSVMSGLSRISDASVDLFSNMGRNVSTRSIAMSEVSAPDMHDREEKGGDENNETSLNDDDFVSPKESPASKKPAAIEISSPPLDFDGL